MLLAVRLNQIIWPHCLTSGVSLLSSQPGHDEKLQIDEGGGGGRRKEKRKIFSEMRKC